MEDYLGEDVYTDYYETYVDVPEGIISSHNYHEPVYVDEAVDAYLSEDSTARNAVCQVVNCNQSITLRTDPNTGASEILQIPKNVFVVFLGDMGNGFYKVCYTDCEGYAMASYLSFM